MAYKARNREDLIAGIDEFLDEVIVLPPGEWDPNIRIEPPKKVPSADKRCVCEWRGRVGKRVDKRGFSFIGIPLFLFVKVQKQTWLNVNICKIWVTCVWELVDHCLNFPLSFKIFYNFC